MRGKPGRNLIHQPVGQPIIARAINQYRRPAEAFMKLGVGTGLVQQDGPGGSTFIHSVPLDVTFARITDPPDVNGKHSWREMYLDPVDGNLKDWPSDLSVADLKTTSLLDPIYELFKGSLPVGLVVKLEREANSGSLVYDGEGLWWQAKSPATIVAAKSGNIPTPFQAALFTWDGTNEVMPGTPQMVQSRNNYPATIAANKVIWMVMRRGKWFTPVESCV
jgi:hypothetical protein